jgi:hypothetical protein
VALQLTRLRDARRNPARTASGIWAAGKWGKSLEGSALARTARMRPALPRQHAFSRVAVWQARPLRLRLTRGEAHRESSLGSGGASWVQNKWTSRINIGWLAGIDADGVYDQPFFRQSGGTLASNDIPRRANQRRVPGFWAHTGDRATEKAGLGSGVESRPTMRSPIRIENTASPHKFGYAAVSEGRRKQGRTLGYEDPKGPKMRDFPT